MTNLPPNLFTTYVEPWQWIGTLKFEGKDPWGPKNQLIELAQQLNFPILPVADVDILDVKLNPFNPASLTSHNHTQNTRYELALDIGEFPLLYDFIQGVKKLTPLVQVYEFTSVYSSPKDDAFKLTILVGEELVCRLIRAEWQPTYDIKNEFAGWRL